LKAHYPAAFYTAMLNNQPMGFYSPATLVKDAQRRGVRFAPIDVQVSTWDCAIEEDGRVRLGLRYVAGLRQEVGRAIEEACRVQGPQSGVRGPVQGPGSCGRCPKCGSEDASMIERVGGICFCNVCAHQWEWDVGRAFTGRQLDGGSPQPRFASVDEFVARTSIHRDELRALADIGALNAFGYDRRSAAWQIEQAMRSAGELYQGLRAQDSGLRQEDAEDTQASPLHSMSLDERIVADFNNMGLTIGPHPMARRRHELALRGVLRASDLPAGRHGRRVRVAGAVITRQRPGTAKGFVFLTLEDETGIANVIVRPDLFAEQRRVIVGEPYLLVEGTLQIQEGVTSIKAERLYGLTRGGPNLDARDFH
jgi:error-prone DNA polymerase